MLISSIKAKSHVNMVMRSTTSISTDRLFILTLKYSEQKVRFKKSVVINEKISNG
jgi:hypothetical protein